MMGASISQCCPHVTIAGWLVILQVARRGKTRPLAGRLATISEETLKAMIGNFAL